MLIARREDGCVLLRRRPEQGIWGGLWCLPEFRDRQAAQEYALRRLQRSRIVEPVPAEPLRHGFTHFDLLIRPFEVRCEGATGVQEPGDLWYNPRRPQGIGVPAPVRVLLQAR